MRGSRARRTGRTPTVIVRFVGCAIGVSDLAHAIWGPVPFDVAAQLGVAPGDEAVIRDRIMGDPETGRPTQLATSYIPAGLAAELPVLAARDTGPGGIDDRMEEAGLGPIRCAEAITARPP